MADAATPMLPFVLVRLARSSMPTRTSVVSSPRRWVFSPPPSAALPPPRRFEQRTPRRESSMSERLSGSRVSGRQLRVVEGDGVGEGADEEELGVGVGSEKETAREPVRLDCLFHEPLVRNLDLCPRRRVRECITFNSAVGRLSWRARFVRFDGRLRGLRGSSAPCPSPSLPPILPSY